MNATPKFATIPDWCALSGMRRTGVYQAIADGHLRAVKLGGRTLVDVEPGLAWLNSLPPADIRMPATRRAA